MLLNWFCARYIVDHITDPNKRAFVVESKVDCMLVGTRLNKISTKSRVQGIVDAGCDQSSSETNLE